ncbi:GDP-fucose transporter 1 [Bacillus rossius redtenbacheri]|uniref:GDP-fucose transporter 1 n=1 Tax=Bacillus rossius redtenbacheri TaxID=93214 RepID=UPI002FDEA1BA
MVNDGLLAKYIQITIVVAAYWCISILTVFVNKALLSGATINLDAPLFVTWYQCVVSATICFTLSRLTKTFPNIFSFPDGSPLDPEVIKKVIPLSILFTAMIAFNNLCLKYVDVSFYYIGRSLTTVFNVILTYLVLRQKTSIQTVACCAIIVSGFFLGVDQESVAGSLSILGTVFGVLGSLSLSMYSIYTKQVLPFVDQQIWLLSYYNNVYSMVLFLPLIVINQEISAIVHYEKLTDWYFWFLMTIGGLCGFSIGFVTALQIKVTSPLTHNISGTAKACAQTVLATYWYEESRPTLWWLSNWVVLGGSAAYTRVKQKEMEKNHSQTKLPTVTTKI